MSYGSDTKLGLAFQNSHGTAANVASLYPVPFLSESVTPNRPELIGQNMFGDFHEGPAYRGPQNVGGTLRSEAQSKVLGVYLRALMGNPTTSTVNGAVKSHVFKPRTSDFDVNVVGIPMSFYKQVGDADTSAFFYKDLVCVAAELAVANGEFLTINGDFVGGQVGKVASQDVGLDTSERFTWDVTSLQLGGAANTAFSSISIRIDEQASPRWTLRQSRDAARVKRDGKRLIRVSGTLLYSDQSEYDKFISNSGQNFVLHMRNTAEVQSGYYDEILIEIPKLVYLAHPIESQDAGEIQVQFEAKADYSAGSGTTMAITLQNTQAAY